MNLYGDIHVAMHGELRVLQEVYELIDEWVDEYPHFEEMGNIAEEVGHELERYETEEDDTVVTLEWGITTEASAVVLVFLNDMVEAYPQMEMAVAAKFIYATSGATEYFAYYSPAESDTIFAAAEDPFSDENRVIKAERDWYEDDWDEADIYEEKASTEEFLYHVDWEFPEEAEWIPFGR